MAFRVSVTMSWLALFLLTVLFRRSTEQCMERQDPEEISGPSFCPIPCINGECVVQTTGGGLIFYCRCDPGWGGQTCEECWCDKACVNGECILDRTDNIQYCECHPGYTGDLCDTRQNYTSTPEITTTGTRQQTTTNSDPDSQSPGPDPQSPGPDPQSTPGPTVYCNGEYHQLSPQSQCVIPCYMGACSIHFSDGFVFYCECDQGWTGGSCDVCCDKPCVSNQGVCDVDYSTGQQSCHCHHGYSGDLCEVQYNSSYTSTQEPHTDTTQDTTTYQTVLCNNQLVQLVPQKDCYVPCHRGECFTNITDDGIIFSCRNCEKGWINGNRPSCEVCCDLDCIENVTYCDVDDGVKRCRCINDAYTEDSNCTLLVNPPDVVTESPTLLVNPPDVVTESPTWLWYAVGFGVGVPVVLVVMLVYLMVYLYRHRNIRYEDRNRPFHVFISYRCSPIDEAFVIRKLVPKLKSWNLKVCVHYENFIPGATISECIIAAVKSSCRTILLISPDFCSGDFTRFETQMAQAEMLQLRHMIVPIMFRDISELRRSKKICQLLENILSSIQYLEWPGEEGPERALHRFWQKLRLSMPKVKADAVVMTTDLYVADAETERSQGDSGISDTDDSTSLQNKMNVVLSENTYL